MGAKGIKAENVAHFNNKLVINLLLDGPLSCVELAKKPNYRIRRRVISLTGFWKWIL